MARAVECIDVGTLRLAEYPTPALAEDAVLLKVRRAGVCGTDLEGIKGRRTLRYPVIPGHEIAAVVEKVGGQAQRHIRIFGADMCGMGNAFMGWFSEENEAWRIRWDEERVKQWPNAMRECEAHGIKVERWMPPDDREAVPL